MPWWWCRRGGASASVANPPEGCQALVGALAATYGSTTRKEGQTMNHTDTTGSTTPTSEPVPPAEVDPETGTDPDGTPTENPSG
ncbi:hypothetical protein M2152_002270 [Microbacteriaceae bacterium SG_E_30_P1]|uniref:Uncharacterized protein n=1 Tax=Antiquaquibacter oligotrophicus TaxID=2880260 RepID=A0ABT6KQ37_9MICO|nr:hypothetical protein [Antiquaquibacter oligotrophicus]